MRRIIVHLALAFLFLASPARLWAQTDADSILTFLPAILASHPGKLNGVKVTIGTNTIQAKRLIGSAGGTISVTSGPLAGVKVVFPPGAVDQDTAFTLSYNSGTLVPKSGTASGRLLDIHSSGATTFNEPVSVTVPYDKTANVVPVPYHVDSSGYLEPCQVKRINRTAGTITYDIFHTSLFTEIWAALTGEGGATTYRPATNGFQIVNTGSSYNPGGECFGISAFAQWYFSNKADGLYPKYMEDIPLQSGGTRKGQSIIATRAHTSLGQQWNSYIPAVTAQYNLTQEDIYVSIINAIKNVKLPVMLYLKDKETAEHARHAVLAYDYYASSGAISINDPNYPGQVLTARYDGTTKKFLPYNGYKGIYLIGLGSFFTESFDSIYKDAESGFDGSGDAQVTITSHTFDQEVNQRTVTIVGKIESGQVLVTKIKLTLNGTTPFEAAVDAQGNFSVPVSLNYGENTIAFTTYGKNAKGFTVETPNNQLTPFKLKLILNKAVILVTLTWNTNNTDLDLYVIDPTGDASWYQHKTTADGGQLDYDDTSGYGPEHWTLLDTNVVRWGQAYRVRVHYYSDHQSGTPEPPTIPSGYTINVLLYEGTANPVTLNYSGVLSSESTSNISPTATGPDWANVVDIIPVQPTSGAQPQFIRDPSGPVKLLVPISEEMLAPKQESPPRQ